MPGTIVNRATGRRVAVDGSLGRAILAERHACGSPKTAATAGKKQKAERREYVHVLHWSLNGYRMAYMPVDVMGDTTRAGAIKAIGRDVRKVGHTWIADSRIVLKYADGAAVPAGKIFGKGKPEARFIVHLN